MGSGGGGVGLFLSELIHTRYNLSIEQMYCQFLDSTKCVTAYPARGEVEKIIQRLKDKEEKGFGGLSWNFWEKICL